MPLFATEQQVRELTPEEKERVPEAIYSILDWLDNLATTLLKHREDPKYAETKRKSGTAHKESPLSAAEQETRRRLRRAQYELNLGRDLNRRWTARELTYASARPWEWQYLDAFWDGSLRTTVEELKEAKGRNPACRRPSVQLR